MNRVPQSTAAGKRTRLRSSHALLRSWTITPLLTLAALLAALAFSPSVALAAPCPNEQLRTEDYSTTLPDCRAYELVTPPFKAGQIVYDAVPPALAADGASVAFETTAGFGDAGDDPGQYGTFYVTSRGVSGWSSLPVSPSAAQSQGAGPSGGPNIDFSSDLQQALLVYAPVGSTPVDKRFYIAQAQPGLPAVEVGPAFPPAKAEGYSQADAEAKDHPNLEYDGATGELSHVFFSLRNAQGRGGLIDWLWPGDTTVPEDSGAPSLYEYVGSGHTGVGGDAPALVGVSDGRTLRDGSTLAAGELISQCGTMLGGIPFTGIPGGDTPFDTYNAFSQDGESVFFTAPHGGPSCKNPVGVTGESPAVDEVYARISNSELCGKSEKGLSSPCTVAISEPSRVDCATCDVEVAAQKPAAFQGAADDGSRVFFLSEQALLPGASGVSLYEYSFDYAEEGKARGESVSLVAPEMAGGVLDPGGVMRVSEDGGLVYFVSYAKLAGNVDALGRQAVEGEDNMYVYDTHTRRDTFVAALTEGDGGDWELEDVRPVQATPDGRFLLFPSSNDLTPDAVGATGNQLYRYDAEPSVAEEEAHVPRLVRASIGEDGFNDNDDVAAGATIAGELYKYRVTAARQPVDISDDGSRVFFQSTGALTEGALNHVCAYETAGECQTVAENVYEWEQAGAGSCPATQSAGCVFLISDGLDDHASSGGGSAVQLIGSDASGDNVFFQTADPLVGQDTDTQLDIYDARVGGGFPAPGAPAECESGGDCQGAASPSPLFGVPGGTAFFSGPGNLAPPPPAVGKPISKKTVKCIKGKVRKGNKCVKRSKTKKRAKKSAHANRRTGR